MPTREEIVEWLKKAALIADYAVMKNSLKFSYGPVKKKSIFHQRAAQVAAMQCETCKWWDNSPWQVSPETRLCLFPEKRSNAESWSGMTECGPKFGCFHYEQKPAG